MADTDGEIARRQGEVEAADREFGEQDFRSLNARTLLGFAYRDRGLPALGTPLHQRVLREFENIHGPMHKNTITARMNLGNNYYYCDRPAQAYALYQQAAEEAAAVLGPHDKDTVLARSWAADCLLAARDFNGAIAAYQRVLPDWAATVKPDNVNFLTDRYHLACAIDAAGDTQEAMGQYSRLLSDCQRLLGPEHTLTRRLTANLVPAPRPWHATGQLTTHQLWLVGLSSILDGRSNGAALWTLYPRPWLNRYDDHLESDWGVTGRGDLLSTAQWLAEEGHRMQMAPALGHPPAAWDFARYAYMVRNGLAMEYIGADEAWRLLGAIAGQAFAAYGSWQDYAADYLAGRELWLGGKGGKEPDGYPSTTHQQTVDAIGRLLDPANAASPWNLARWDAPRRPDQRISYPPPLTQAPLAGQRRQYRS